MLWLLCFLRYGIGEEGGLMEFYIGLVIGYAVYIVIFSLAVAFFEVWGRYR